MAFTITLNNQKRAVRHKHAHVQNVREFFIYKSIKVCAMASENKEDPQRKQDEEDIREIHCFKVEASLNLRN
jgi:hypothetical protein